MIVIDTKKIIVNTFYHIIQNERRYNIHNNNCSYSVNQGHITILLQNFTGYLYKSKSSFLLKRTISHIRYSPKLSVSLYEYMIMYDIRHEGVSEESVMLSYG